MKFALSSLIIAGFIMAFLQKSKKDEVTLQGIGSNDALFIISEAGCITCNKKYMEYIMKNAINKKHVGIYSAASGMLLDVSPFLSDTIKNLVPKNENIWDELNIPEGSYFVNFEKSKVDTIIKIEPSTIANSLNYINLVVYR